MDALGGIRVVDFTQAVAGPVCTMLLADFGADVIKVEPPPDGESGRRWGSKRYGDGDQFSSLFLAYNRNKSSVMVDMKQPEGRASVARLVDSADVVVENFKPGVAARLGIGYDQVSTRKPSIVYCSISGYGQTGPLSERPGFDQLMQAYAGHLSITGEPGRPSVRIGPSSIDIMTGTLAAFGILAALRVRDRTGHGQYVDTSLYDTAILMVSQFIADYTGTGRVPEKSGPYFAFLVPYGVFEAADREVYLGPSGDRMVADLFSVLGLPNLINDGRFRTNGDRIANRAALHDLIVPEIRKRQAAELAQFCVEKEIPTALIQDISEVVAQEQAQAREMVVETGVANVRAAGIPIKLSLTPGVLRTPPPPLGSANDGLLGSGRPGHS